MDINNTNKVNVIAATDPLTKLTLLTFTDESTGIILGYLQIAHDRGESFIRAMLEVFLQTTNNLVLVRKDAKTIIEVDTSTAVIEFV